MRVVLIGVVGAVLASACSSQENGAACTAPPSTTLVSPEDMKAGPIETTIARQRAEACVHNAAYRLASSFDQADMVARAAVQACEVEVARAVSLVRYDFYRDSVAVGLPDVMAATDRVEANASASYREYALLKVVEGRAGKCKPVESR